MSRRQKRSRLERRRRASVRALQVGGGAVVAALAPTAAAHAATTTYNVTNLNDSGPGSLRQAMTDANAAGGTATDDIVFASSLSGTVHLQSHLPGLSVPMDIQGPGARKVALDASAIGSSNNPAIYAAGEALTISGLSMNNAIHARFRSRGGFVYTYRSSLTLVDDSFSGNRAWYGGAVGSEYGTVNISGSTFEHNHATGYGGGALGLYGVTASVYDSTIVSNAATGRYGSGLGGGIAVGGHGENAKIVGSTITGNVAEYGGGGTGTAGYGGGVAVNYYGSAAVENSVVAGNTATGNPHASSPLSRRDVFVNTRYSGTSATASFSLIQNDATQPGLTVDSSDITGKAAGLGPVQDNGGPTDTELPAASSPVVDAGKAFGLKSDQRGLARTVSYPGKTAPAGGDGTDMGAAELQLPPVVSGLSPASGAAGTSVTISGTGFGHATAVKFGGRFAKFTVVDADHIRATAPVGGGTQDVRVFTHDGQSAVVAADRFSYPGPVKAKRASFKHSGKVGLKRKGRSEFVLTGLTVSCPAGGDACHVSVSGEASVPATLARVRKHKTKRLKVGSAAVVVKAGRHEELEFRLNGKALRALRRKHRLRITISARASDGSVKSSAKRTITVRLPRHHKKK
jgi:hypothetical protein